MSEDINPPAIEAVEAVPAASATKHCPARARLLTALAYLTAGTAVLFVSDIPGDIGESLCGSWGCLPPVQSLISMHLLWCVIATAVVHFLAARNLGSLRLEGSVLILVSGVAMAWVVGRDLLEWLSWMTPDQVRYWPRRILHTLATQSDLPLVPTFFAGVALCAIDHRRRRA